MYTLNADPGQAGLPAWVKQLSSLKAERMESIWDSDARLDPKIKEWYLQHRVTECVQCMTFDEAMREYRIS